MHADRRAVKETFKSACVHSKAGFLLSERTWANANQQLDKCERCRRAGLHTFVFVRPRSIRIRRNNIGNELTTPKKQAEVNHGIPDPAVPARAGFPRLRFTDLVRAIGASGYGLCFIVLTRRAHERESIYPLPRGEEPPDTRSPGLVQDVSGHRAAC